MPPGFPAVHLQVENKDIGLLHFPEEEVLDSVEKIIQRRLALERAVVLGNSYKGKAKIVFEDETGIREIETNIWGITDKRVILKQGIIIPLHRIHEVKL